MADEMTGEARDICRDLGFPELRGEPAGAPTDNASWAYLRVLKALSAAHARGREQGIEEAAKACERSGVCSADASWNRNQIAAAIRALKKADSP